ncbi:hypothetical protein HOD20_01355 [archaeon]|jgi:hypothetical protein|nr:hypothetical protein [archaeon]MBT4646777.1 hypothetical protein [archaeon]MBT6822070.1 hypothetical protein [archaeon]MBT7392931.1 hypothetical protein [archaeon]
MKIKYVVIIIFLFFISNCEPDQLCNDANVYFHDEIIDDLSQGAYCVCSDSYYLLQSGPNPGNLKCNCFDESITYTTLDNCENSNGCNYLLENGCFERAKNILKNIEVIGTPGNIVLCDNFEVECISQEEEDWEEENYCGKDAICCADNEDDYYRYDEICKCKNGEIKYPEFDGNGNAEFCTSDGEENSNVGNALVQGEAETIRANTNEDECRDGFCNEGDICTYIDGCNCYCDKDGSVVEAHPIEHNWECGCDSVTETMGWGTTLTDYKIKYVFFIVPMGDKWESDNDVKNEIESSISVLTKVSKFELSDIDYHIVPLSKMESDEKCNTINEIPLNHYSIYFRHKEIMECIEGYIEEKDIKYMVSQYIYVGYDSRNSANVGGFANPDALFSLIGDNFFYVGYKGQHNIFTHEFTHLFGVCDEYDITDYNEEVPYYGGCPNKFPGFCKNVEACKEEFGNDVDFCTSNIKHSCPGNFVEFGSNKILDDCASAIDRFGNNRVFSIMGTKDCGLDPVAYELVSPYMSLD